MVITEGYKFGEALFQPSLMGQDGAKGVHELIHSSLQEVDAADGSLFETCLQNVVTTGGSTAFKNFNERVQLELSNPWLSNGCRHALDPDLVKIWSPPILSEASFSGAEVLLANRPLYDRYTVTKAEYEEHGAHLINKKLGLL
jgi:actin-related protein